MNEMKLNKSKGIEDSDFSVIPDVPEVEEIKDSYVKKTNDAEGRKLFSNKKANVAIIVVAVVVLLVTVGTFIFVNYIV